MFKNFIQTTFIVLVTIIVVLIFGYWKISSQTEINKETPQNSDSHNRPKIVINGKELEVSIADTIQKQTRGLSNQENLAENEGMLFVFDQPHLPSFWMKDMRFPIDIIWIDANKKIIGINKNLSPETYPQKFTPPQPVLYVLEVNAGWSDKNKAHPGDMVIF